MPNILKRFTGQTPEPYQFPAAEDLTVAEEAPPPAPAAQAPAPAPPPAPPPSPVDYAKVQADAILADARREAEAIQKEAREAAAGELEDLRREARAEGYHLGFAEGMARAMTEAKLQREQQAVAQAKAVGEFLEEAAALREQMLEQNKEELKELALTIAEKVIQVSLRSSGDIILRMIEGATARYKRREWATIYIAGCDAKTMAYTIPELTAALGGISDRVRIIPMADDEPGTCIIELPDEIIDASTSTQIANMRAILSSAGVDRGGE